MKVALEKLFASLVSVGIHLLHNRNTPRFSRDEIRYLRLSFSQFGEDIGLGRWFDEFFQIKNGVYVDVGAFHPIHFSNTLSLAKERLARGEHRYECGQDSTIQRIAPGDVNVHAAVSNVAGKASAFRSGLVEQMVSDPNGEIPVRRLDEILAQTSFRKIDYLNIDCEGHDFDVLRSISLDLYEPNVITVEALGEEDRPASVTI